MKQVYKTVAFVLMAPFLMNGCKLERYEKNNKEELGRWITIDSMPFGWKLGNSKKDFYERCWALNKTGVITQGPGNEYARHYM